jgi:hypothetical protein
MNFSRTFNAWKFVTPDKLIVKLPLHSLRAQDYAFKQMDICHQGNQIVLLFDNVSKISKDSVIDNYKYEGLRTQHSDPPDQRWR